MERFAFKIDGAIKANLYKICRLCGIDNPSKVKILPNASEIIDLDEPTLGQKVFEVVGFMVAPNDKMPQTMCSLCVDKINDFYEFREMCYATNDQTRKLLGLKPQSEPQRLMDVKSIFKTEPLSKRGRKRKTDDNVQGAAASSSSNSAKQSASEIPLDMVKNEPVGWRKKQRLQQLTASKTEVKEEPAELDPRMTTGKKGRKASCSVCGERFESKELAEEHKSITHVPMVMRYTCNACNQNHHNPSDIKAHQLWHKLSKTPYQCPRCDVSVANNYAFSRHLREHTVATPLELLVLDRECPLCRKTFLTNYFYNTHPCARRTRKCGGCSRVLSSEVAYMRHAPYCAKIYLSHSKHIMPEAADREAEMRIKNENDLDVEPTAYGQEGSMQPVVVLERLGSPLLRTIAGSRSSDRVSSKKYLKRVDQLLKNTMNTLVSIKHEPEVHIDDTGPQLESDPDEEPSPFDDFHAGNDDSDEDAADTAAADTTADISTVSVKQELIDEGYERQQIKQEPLKLKLKITNNHGQLNSSIVDDDDNDFQQHQLSRSAKKKRKRKHKERNKDAEAETAEEETPPTDATERTTEEIQVSAEAVGRTIVTVKQERDDESYADSCEPQATVMTSIPMLQLDSSFAEVNQATVEAEDVKPNRLELDRLMKITHIASGVAMAEEATPPEKAVEAIPNEIPANPMRKSATKSTARKSTGGAAAAATTSKPPPAENQLPKIVSVESGAALPFNILAIKPEPLNRGYADEQVACTDQREAHKEINHNEKIDEETRYINSLDLSNVIIKQEKDLHICDVNLNGSEADNVLYNGLRESVDDDDDHDDDDDGGDDDSASSADEADENMDTLEEQEVRIYREIELPLLEEEEQARSPVNQSTTAEVHNESVILVQQSVPAPSESKRTGNVQLGQPPPSIVEPPKSPGEPEDKFTKLQSESETMEQETTPDALVEQYSEQESPLGALVEQSVSKVEPTHLDNTLETDDKVKDSQTVVGAMPIAESQAEPPDGLQPDNILESQREPQNAALEQNLLQTESKSGKKTETITEKKLEPQPGESQQSHFGLVITNVCSQAADNPLSTSSKDAELTEKSVENIVSAPKEAETLAQPFFNNSSTSNDNCDEEQQNVLNHELSSASGQPVEEADEQQLETEEQQLEVEAGPSSAACCELLNNEVDKEETDNRINEQQQELQHVQQQPRCLVNDYDSNINEIAENNNNANIERELNDDANVVAAQENPIT
ncbi:GH22430 [Drosophila grimshawi]|uniref:GH22430 n=1 Tax=Drosophila grimshawi TaxID=7222 RepID=B4JSH1_DROGR|nr:GH22430 [Drosophila grimshawi]